MTAIALADNAPGYCCMSVMAENGMGLYKEITEFSLSSGCDWNNG